VPKARPGSLICVFDCKSNRLLYQLEPDDSIPFTSKLALRSRSLSGKQFEVYAVSRLSKTFFFQTDFTFDNTRISTVVFNTRVNIKEPASAIAVAVIEGEDPLRNLCTSIKSNLESMYRQVCFENTEQVNQFVDEFNLAVRSVKKPDNPYLKLEVLDIQYNDLQFKREVGDKIVRKEVMDSKLEKLRKFRDKKLSEHSEIEELQEIFIKIPQIIPRDLTRMEEYVFGVVRDFMLESVQKYWDKKLSEHSEIEELQEILDLIPPSISGKKELVFIINSLTKPRLAIENKSTFIISDSTEDEKGKDNKTTQSEREPRWRGHKKTKDIQSNQEH
jgi:hypothetical protein